MNKKIMMVTVLCGLIGMAELSAFTPGLYFTSGRMASKGIIKGLANSFSKIKIKHSAPRAVRGLGKESLAALVAAKTATVVPAMIPSVPVVAVLPKAFPSAAQVAAGLAAEQSYFMRLVQAAYGSVGQVAPKVAPSVITSVPAVVAALPKAFPSAAQVAAGLAAEQSYFMRLAQAAYGPVVQAMPKNVPVETIAQVTKSAVMTPLKKALAAGCATAVAGMGYVGSLFAHTPSVVVVPLAVAPLVSAPTAFQYAVNSLSQHKMVATGVAVATLTTAYCARYKINPVTKMKKYFGSPKDPLVIIYER